MNSFAKAFAVHRGDHAVRERRRPRLRFATCIAFAGWIATNLATTGIAVETSATNEDRSLASLKQLSVEELMAVEIPKVFGASKHEQTLREAPSSVSLVTRDDIQRFGYRTLADVLRGVRGIYVSTDRLYEFVGVRGFNRPGDFGGRTLILVDGHRLNDPIFDSSFVGTDFLLDVDLIERVEVVRGPGSVLYGNNAFFGVINVVTRRGKDVKGAEASGAAGSHDAYTGRLTYGNKFKNDLELLVSGSLYRSEGQRRIYVPEFEALGARGGIVRASDDDAFQNVFTSVRYRQWSLEGGYNSRRKDPPFAIYDTVINDPRGYSIDQRAFVTTAWADTIANHWETSVRGYFDSYRLFSNYPYDAADPGDPPNVVVNREIDHAQWTGLEAQTARVFRDRFRLTLGLEARHDFFLSVFAFDDPSGTETANFKTGATRVGTFAQGEIPILTNFSATVGVRYDYYSAFGNTLNPRVALIYSPLKASTLKFLYGQAYRAPSMWEYAFDSFNQRANANLSPERIRSYELVYEQELTHATRFTLSGYLNQTEDLIVATEDDTDPRPFFDNLDSTETIGVETEIEHRSDSGWLARASYALQRTKDATTGAELSNSPRHLVKSHLSMPLWEKKLFGGIELLYSSRALTIPGRTIRFADDYWLVNVTLFSRELVRGLEISASLYNLFDHRYSYPVGDEYRIATVPQDGRTFRVKLTYRF